MEVKTDLITILALFFLVFMLVHFLLDRKEIKFISEKYKYLNTIERLKDKIKDKWIIHEEFIINLKNVNMIMRGKGNKTLLILFQDNHIEGIPFKDDEEMGKAYEMIMEFLEDN